MVIALTRATVSAAPPWLGVGDKEFAREHGKQALSDDLKAQSRVAWMLFARVNQPRQNNMVTWETWPSNQDTFDTPTERFTVEKKVRPRPHLQPSIVHQLLSRMHPSSTPNTAGEEITRNAVSYSYIWDDKLNTAATARERLSSGPPVRASRTRWHAPPSASTSTP